MCIACRIETEDGMKMECNTYLNIIDQCNVDLGCGWLFALSTRPNNTKVRAGKSHDATLEKARKGRVQRWLGGVVQPDRWCAIGELNAIRFR